MKKIILTILISISALIITGCGGPTTYDEIDYTKLKDMLNQKQDLILFIGSETCSACASYKPTLNKVIKKYKVDVKYLDISKLSEKESSELQSKFPFTGTPTTIFVKKGKEEKTYNRIDGNQRYSKIVEKFKSNGYIKEK